MPCRHLAEFREARENSVAAEGFLKPARFGSFAQAERRHFTMVYSHGYSYLKGNSQK